jgi:selenide, water dikinase
VGPCDLRDILAKLPEERRPELLSSIMSGEDAGVYLLSDDLALVQTVDFFPPIVDDPRAFGQIAAANALSDIYAMGARPLTAMNIVAFPKKLCGEVLEAVLLGGYDKVHEAGAVVIGGHTIEDDEPKYGLAVTGVVDPAKMMTVSAASKGDGLVLTKGLGTGVIATALKAGMADREVVEAATKSMMLLNRSASEAFLARGVRACTDVTGFGLMGHLSEMLKASDVSARLWERNIPLLPGAVELAVQGMLPEGAYANREGADVDAPGVTREVLDCMYDPQTSGGLLACVDRDMVDDLLAELRKSCPRASLIGEVAGGSAGSITVLPGKE